MNFDDFEHNEKNLPEEHHKKALYYENIRKEFLKEITEATDNNDFFKDHKKVDVDAFKLKYARDKAHLSEYYKIYLEYANSESILYKADTEKIFSTIKFKQLFNLQIKWRAEEIVLEGVETTYDFEFFHNNINECYFLPPITAQEVQLLKEFIVNKKIDIDYIDDIYSWQYFNLIMPSSPEDECYDYPEWYKFYDERMGTGDLLLLPDIKVGKEEKYTNITSDKRMEIIKRKEEEESKKIDLEDQTIALIDLRSNTGVNFENFAKQFENDKHIIELFRQYKIKYTFSSEGETEEEIPTTIYNENDIEDGHIEGIVKELCEIEENVPITKELQWRESLIHCYKEHKRERILSLIDDIYEEYEMLLNLGISGSKSKAELLKEMESNYRVMFQRNRILEGRKDLGEPLDFNY